MKNKIILFFISFVLLSIYTLVNMYLMENTGKSEIVSNYLYEDLKKDMDILLNEKNIKYDGYKILGATMIERNIYSFFDQIIINRGREDGVSKNDAVVSEDGLVGIVSEVEDSYCKVMLVTNNDINLSVKIGESYAVYNNGIIDNVIDYYLINEKDKVYTSGLTNIPEGIYVGEVKELDKDNAKARIDLVSLKNLKYVYIIIGE
ncbi:MAG: rod shape-determining protein MreC [Bacilli bacterium]